MSKWDQPYRVFETEMYPAKWKVGRFLEDDNSTGNYFRDRVAAETEASLRNTERRTVVDFFDIDDLIMSTTYYYLGSRCAGTVEHCDRLVAAWPKLSEYVRKYVQQKVEGVFQRAAICEANGMGHTILGESCDREGWERVRACWQKPTQD